MISFTILIVDDDPRILKSLGACLYEAGYEVLKAGDGLQALECIRADKADLVVLDIMMPGIDGLETLRRIRATSSVPVIFASALDDDTDKIRGLRLGADDYLAKPFETAELVARIEAIRRRIELNTRLPARYVKGNLVIDFEGHRVMLDGVMTPLTPIEWRILSELANNQGRFLSPEELLSRVWGNAYAKDSDLLRTWVSRLRGKLKDDAKNPHIIHTIPRIGYEMYPLDPS